MKTIKFDVFLSIGFTSRREAVLEFEIEDDATPEEIESVADELTHEWANNYIEYGFSIKK